MSIGFEDLKILSGTFNILIILGHCPRPRPQTNNQAFLFYNDFRIKITTNIYSQNCRAGSECFFLTYHKTIHIITE